MGKRTGYISKRQQDFIKAQRLFFVATATEDSQVNLSPKGMDTLRVFDQNRIVWLNLTGSGNETAAHLIKKDRITLMFCAFEGPPMILRLYGRAKVYHVRDRAYKELISSFPPMAGSRQLIDVKVELVQVSCGMGVPYYNYVEERNQLEKWAKEKKDGGLELYWTQKNAKSLDGEATGIPE